MSDRTRGVSAVAVVFETIADVTAGLPLRVLPAAADHGSGADTGPWPADTTADRATARIRLFKRLLTDR